MTSANENKTVDSPAGALGCFFYNCTIEMMSFLEKEETKQIDTTNSTFHKKAHFFLSSLLVLFLFLSRPLSNLPPLSLDPGRLPGIDYCRGLPCSGLLAGIDKWANLARYLPWGL